MSNPVILLLSAEKLDGDNYAKWKSNMNILLINDDYKFVLLEECPPEPAANASKTAREPYDRWIKANSKAKCYMLASMSDVLRKKHEGMETAYEISESLEAMFGAPSDKARLDAVSAFMNDKMKSGSSVKAHVLNMIEHLHEAEINGATIDERTQVFVILQSLAPTFKEFVNNFVMNKKQSNLTELLNDLQNFESTNRPKGGEANVAEAGPSGTKRKNQGKGKAKKGKPKKDKKKKKPKVSDQKPKGKCFHCNAEGHWKRNCKKFLEEVQKKKEQGKCDLLVLETCLVEGDTSAWIVDSGATNHVCFSLQVLSSYSELADGEYTMRVGNGQRVSAKAVGEVRLRFRNNRFLFLNNVYFVPDIRRNLISVSKLLEQSFKVSFNDEFVHLSRNGLNVCSGRLDDGLYCIKPIPNSLLNTEMFRVAEPKNKRQKISHNNDTYLWHLRLGHINLNRIERLVKDGPLSELRVSELPVCESCLEGKMTK